MKTHVLVVANRTASSDELIGALRERAARGPAQFDLVVPPSVCGAQGRAEMERTVEEAVARLREAGLEASGQVGADTDVVIAVTEAYDPRRHDEIVVSTLPAGSSQWLRSNVPGRIARATGALVHHVVVHEPRVPLPATPRATDHEPPGLLAPLLALGYGRRQEPARG